MSWKHIQMKKVGLMLGLVLLALGIGGCGRAAQEQREERDPYLRRALARKEVQDFDGAVDLCQKALERRPTLARAHLELGLLFDTYKQDYLRACYHYQRYLEMRPDTDKRALIEDLINHCRLMYAATFPNEPPGAAQEIKLLKNKIALLEEELARLQPRRPAASAAVPAAAPAGGAPAPRPQPAQPAVQTYTVQEGDTLSSIAGKFYRDREKWRIILEANKQVISEPKNVRPGQTLVIPAAP